VIDFGIAKATGGERLTDMTVFTAYEQIHRHAGVYESGTGGDDEWTWTRAATSTAGCCFMS